MARTLEFDYNDALDRATWLFWGTGYSGASLRDLLKIMGIGEGSFYNVFKSKKQLYLDCLKHYKNTVGGKRSAALSSGLTARQGVRALFQSVLDGLDNPQMPRACLLAGSVSWDVLAEPDLRNYVEEELGGVVERLTARLTAGKEAGDLPPEFDTSVVAPIIATYLHGLFRMAPVSYDRPQLERQIDVFLKGLGC